MKGKQKKKNCYLMRKCVVNQVIFFVNGKDILKHLGTHVKDNKKSFYASSLDFFLSKKQVDDEYFLNKYDC